MKSKINFLCGYTVEKYCSNNIYFDTAFVQRAVLVPDTENTEVRVVYVMNIKIVKDW